jgi:tetratricopeptide (TPR) repeat protein
MSQKEIIDTYQKISELLTGRQLKDSFGILDLQIQALQNGFSFAERKANLENTYKMMLQYAVDGVQDPESHLIYKKLITSVYALADEVKEALLLRDAVSYEYSQIRYYAAAHPPRLQLVFSELRDVQVNMSLAQSLEGEEAEAKFKEFRKRYETIQAALFNKIWLTQEFSGDDFEVIREAMNNDKMLVADKCLLVSALMLNLLRIFDERKILLLLDFYGHKEEWIRQRALIGIMLAMYLYNNRLTLYPAVRNRLVLLADDDNFRKNVQFVILQFIRTRQTEGIVRKMREEILPEMLKLSPLLKQKVDFDVNSVEDLEEKNPDWYNVIENSKVGDKLKEISELQEEGADVMMGTFAALKNFQFFNTTSNWFLPFDAENSAIKDTVQSKEETFLSLLLKSPYMCNSDKYSFCLMLAQVPDNQRKNMTSSFKMQSEQLDEIVKDEDLLKVSAKKERVSNQYLQDLYRFFKLFAYRTHFLDIFLLPLDFQNTWFYKNLYFEDSDLREIAEYYFLKSHYKEALSIFLHLIENESDNAELYQKAGYCNQCMGKLDAALEKYLIAETILTDNKWTVKRLALCYRLQRNYEKALEYYRRFALLEPNNVATQMNIGQCLLEMKNYQEALQIFFKIEVTSPENEVKAWRAIAWCSFLAKKMKQAQKYYHKLLNDKPVYADLLNAGHVEWSLGNRQQALEHYQNSIKMSNLSEFVTAFEKDVPDLIAAGVKEDDIPILTDRLKYLI